MGFGLIVMVNEKILLRFKGKGGVILEEYMLFAIFYPFFKCGDSAGPVKFEESVWGEDPHSLG